MFILKFNWRIFFLYILQRYSLISGEEQKDPSEIIEVVELS